MTERKYEIQDVLQSEGVPSVADNRTIFGIAAIGLLIGKARLTTIIHNERLQDGWGFFCKLVKDEISSSDHKKMEIVEDALEFISFDKKKVFINTVEAVMRLELLDVILYIDVLEDNNTGNEIRRRFSYITSAPWMNRLVIELFKLHNGNTLLNIACGSGEFIQQMFENNMNIESVTGHEFLLLELKIAKIKSYFISDRVEIKLTKLFEPAKQNEKYDMIYNAYPVAMKCSEGEWEAISKSWSNQIDFNKKCSADLLLTINSLQRLTENGMLITLVSNGALFNVADGNMRKYLVDNNYISTIINLPVGIIPGTRDATSLIVLKKNNKEDEQIQLIDATSIYTKRRRYLAFEENNINRIIQLYREKSETENSIIVTKKKIVEKKYNLRDTIYIKETLASSVPLSDVATHIFRGYQAKAKELDAISTENKEESVYRIINVSDIQQDGTISENLQAVVIEDGQKIDKYCVENGDIVITAKNTIVKTAIYIEHQYKAIITGNLIAVRLNKDKMNPYYLKSFLDSKTGEKCLDAIQTGTSIISINTNSLKNMEVPKLHMSMQNEIAKDYKRTYEKMIEYRELYKTQMEQLGKIYEKDR